MFLTTSGGWPVGDETEAGSLRALGCVALRWLRADG